MPPVSLKKISSSATSQRALIVGVRRGKMTRDQMERSLDELARLVDTSGAVVAGRASQEIKRADPATLIGSGKAGELGVQAAQVSADLVVIDDELSPVQNRNLEDITGAVVLDRTAIILDIFALRARSREGKLQVELAQLVYLSPRLVGRGETLSQQAGRIGTRGPGETALEYDRRRVKDRITALKRDLEQVRSHRQVHRQKREAVPIPLVSLIGYTNAGKSTLMNAFTDAGVFVEDKLFATLDSTVRRLKLPSGRGILIADTVGFIRRLPHQLVESFKSTFEEVAHSHLLLHVIDGSDEDALVQARVVEAVLQELKLNHKPRIDVINKCDRPQIYYRGEADPVNISALKKDGIDALLSHIDDFLRSEFRHVVLRLPLGRGDILSIIYKMGFVRKAEYEESSILVDCELHKKHCGMYKMYEEVEGANKKS